MADVSGFPGVVDVNNQLAGAVVAGGQIQGVFTDVADFGVIDLLITLDVAAQPITVAFDWSVDGVTAAATETLGGGASGVAQIAYFVSMPTLAQFYRLTITNGSINTRTFTVTPTLRPSRPSGVGFSQSLPLAAGGLVRGALGLGREGDVMDNLAAAAGVLVRCDATPTNHSTFGKAVLPSADMAGALFVHQRAAQLEGRLVRTAFASVGGTGDTTIVAAVGGARICVMEFDFYVIGNPAAARTVIWRDGAGTQLRGSWRFNATSDATGWGLAVAPPLFLMQTAVGQLLKVNLSGAPGTSLEVSVTYIEL